MQLHVLFGDRPQLLLEGIPEDCLVKDVKLEAYFPLQRNHPLRLRKPNGRTLLPPLLLQIQKKVPEVRRLFLRLIFAGRVLDDHLKLGQVPVPDQAFIHCAASQESSGKVLAPCPCPCPCPAWVYLSGCCWNNYGFLGLLLVATAATDCARNWV